MTPAEEIIGLRADLTRILAAYRAVYKAPTKLERLNAEWDLTSALCEINTERTREFIGPLTRSKS